MDSAFLSLYSALLLYIGVKFVKACTVNSGISYIYIYIMYEEQACGIDLYHQILYSKCLPYNYRVIL